jgi:hypothetical protein
MNGLWTTVQCDMCENGRILASNGKWVVCGKCNGEGEIEVLEYGPPERNALLKGMAFGLGLVIGVLLIIWLITSLTLSL